MQVGAVVLDERFEQLVHVQGHDGNLKAEG
jgi:hypothetical protein